MPEVISEQEKWDIAASFQRAAFDDLIKKSRLALEKVNAKAIFFGGGVANNQALRIRFKETFPDIQMCWPADDLSLDNAAMIAGLGYHNYLNREVDNGLNLETMTRIPFRLA